MVLLPGLRQQQVGRILCLEVTLRRKSQSRGGGGKSRWKAPQKKSISLFPASSSRADFCGKFPTTTRERRNAAGFRSSLQKGFSPPQAGVWLCGRRYLEEAGVGEWEVLCGMAAAQIAKGATTEEA